MPRAEAPIFDAKKYSFYVIVVSATTIVIKTVRNDVVAIADRRVGRSDPRTPANKWFTATARSAQIIKLHTYHLDAVGNGARVLTFDKALLIAS